MAYTFLTVASAFHRTFDEDGNPTNEGYDYQSAIELLNRIADTGEGRLYIDESGNLTYESRYHRDA
jgi:hypothetical protein